MVFDKLAQMRRAQLRVEHGIAEQAIRIERHFLVLRRALRRRRQHLHQALGAGVRDHVALEGAFLPGDGKDHGPACRIGERGEFRNAVCREGDVVEFHASLRRQLPRDQRCAGIAGLRQYLAQRGKLGGIGRGATHADGERQHKVFFAERLIDFYRAHGCGACAVFGGGNGAHGFVLTAEALHGEQAVVGARIARRQIEKTLGLGGQLRLFRSASLPIIAAGQ